MLFAERKAKLSPQSQKALIYQQKSWLTYVNLICGPLLHEQGAYGRSECLSRAMADRKTDLKKVGISVGPYTFTNIARYNAAPETKSDGSGTAPGFSINRKSIPQIDIPGNKSVIAFNNFLMANAGDSNDCDFGGDASNGFEVAAAGEAIVSLAKGSGEYCHGAPHGNWQSDALLVEFSKVPRTLKAEDVFSPASDWQAKLKALTDKALTFESKEDDTPKNRNDVVSGGGQFSRWLFKQNGLEYQQSSYDGGCYLCQFEVKILPWSDIKPILKKDSPVWKLMQQSLQ